MENGIVFPFISAANRETFLKRFADLNKLMHHPGLRDDDRIIWIWLATKCINDLPCTCVTSYAHISLCLDKPPRLVQDSLFRLFCTGFLIADLPIHFDEPTLEMSQKVRKVRIKTPYLISLPREKEEDVALVKTKEEAIRVVASMQQPEMEQEEEQKGDIKPQPLSFMQTICNFIKALNNWK